MSDLFHVMSLEDRLGELNGIMNDVREHAYNDAESIATAFHYLGASFERLCDLPQDHPDYKVNLARLKQICVELYSVRFFPSRRRPSFWVWLRSRFA
jgi:hypothetical protein